MIEASTILNEQRIKISLQEKEIARRFLSDNLILENEDFYIKAYSRVSGIQNLNSSFPRLIMIGAGPLPVSIYHTMDLNKVEEAIGIDCDEEAIDLATAVTHKLGRRNISFCATSALDYDYVDAELIFIANLVTEKDKLLKKIYTQTKPKTLVILRDPSPHGPFSSEATTIDTNHWNITAQDSPCGTFHSQSLYLERLA